jgi:hypothetical protein
LPRINGGGAAKLELAQTILDFCLHSQFCTAAADWLFQTLEPRAHY